MMQNYLGIDIGTGSCKAVVFNRKGEQLVSAKREYNIVFSDSGGAELDSEKVIQLCFDLIKECTSSVEPGSVVALSISSQGEAMTAIDEEGKFLCNAMVSSDNRPAHISGTWSDTFGTERLYEITGHTAHPLFSVFKLLWIKNNRKDIWDKASKFFCFEDLLQYRLGIKPSMSWSLAGRTMMFDVLKHNWSDEILKAVGISSDMLATPIQSGEIAGKIPSNITREIGLANNAVVVSGGHDQTCAALGAGITSEGIALYATGSVECITPAFKKPVFSSNLFNNNFCMYDHAAPGMYVTLAYSLTGGNILQWYRNEFGACEIEQAKKMKIDPYRVILSETDSEPSGLLVLPYFTSSGTPYFDTTTKGAILGLRLSTTKGELIRGLLEGVALEMRLNLEILSQSGLNIKELRVVGGGSNSELWTQLKADVIGKEVYTVSTAEAGCQGAAMLACAAHTGIPIENLSEGWVRKIKSYKPKEMYRKIYNDKFNKYKDIYPLIKNANI